MSTRLVAFCSTCGKFRPVPSKLAACEAAGHHLVKKTQRLKPRKVRGLLKRCSCNSKAWPWCVHPWYAHCRVKKHVHRGVLGVFEHRLAAEAALAALKERLQNGQPAAPPVERPCAATFEEFARQWLPTAAGLKASTVRFYTDHLENHIYPSPLGRLPLADIRRTDVKAFIIELREKGLARSTISGIVRTLSRVLSEAFEDEKVVANVALRPGKHIRHANEPKKIPIDPYTREEVALLLRAAREHAPEWYPWLLCALRTGLRLGELRALQWGDIDWRNRFIVVSRNFVEGSMTTPKNGKTRRVDLSSQLRTRLRLWRFQQREAWFKRGLSLPDLVFPSAARTPHDDSKIRKALLAIITRADVRRRASMVHVLRHTFASLLIQQGESLVYVKEQMGHSSIQVTVDVYGHLVPGGNRQAVDRLDDVASLSLAERGVA